jgi:hypothetical protein
MATKQGDSLGAFLSLLRHRKATKYCVITAGVGASAYLAYSLYRQDYLTSIRRSVKKYTSAVDKGGDILQKLLSDLYEYVVEDDGARDDDRGNQTGDQAGDAPRQGESKREVPQSLVNLAQLVKSREFRVATRSTVRAVVEGLVSVDELEDDELDGVSACGEPKTSALDKMLGALLSEKGSSLVSVALSMAAKNVVSTYLETTRNAGERASEPRLDERLFAFLSNPRGQELAIRCISACADSAMVAYTQETRDINVYDQLLETAVKPDHKSLVLECITLSIRAAVSAWNASENDIEAEMCPLVEEDSVPRMRDLRSADRDGAKRHANADDDSPVSALRPPLSSIATPTSSIDTGRMSQAPTTLRRRRNGTHHAPKRGHPNEGILRALSKEFIQVSRDEHGREAIARVVGSVTKEAVGAVANTVADRIDTAYFVSVLLLGVLLSVLANLLLKAVF